MEIRDHACPNTIALHKPAQALLRSARWQAWDNSGPADSAMETHRAAQKAVSLFPTTRVIDDHYLEKALPVIHEQLARAAPRLAGVLNRALGRSDGRAG